MIIAIVGDKHDMDLGQVASQVPIDFLRAESTGNCVHLVLGHFASVQTIFGEDERSHQLYCAFASADPANLRS